VIQSTTSYGLNEQVAPNVGYLSSFRANYVCGCIGLESNPNPSDSDIDAGAQKGAQKKMKKRGGRGKKKKNFFGVFFLFPPRCVCYGPGFKKAIKKRCIGV